MSVPKRNSFSRKMEVKTTEELRQIVDSADYSKDAIRAAQWELDLREENGTLELENQKRIERKLGESAYDDFVKTIKKEKQFKFFSTPSYSESLDNDLKSEVKMGLALRALEKLKWTVVYRDEQQIQARRADETDVFTEQILIGFGPENLLVKSITLGSESIDRGKNSIRVKLFFHVFHETLGEMSGEELELLGQETTKANNWDDYEIPDTLPAPPNYPAEKPNLFYVLTLLSSLILGVLFGVIIRWAYLIIVFDLAMSWLLAKAFIGTIRLSAVTHHKKVQTALIAAVPIIILSAQYIDYYLFISEEDLLGSLNFFEFMRLKFEAGFTLEDTNLGWYGWVGVFILQALIFYFYTQLKLFPSIINYLYSRAPEEVIQFALYHFIKEKTEQQVRQELAAKGWKDERAQDYVFDAIAAVEEQRQGAKED